MRALDAEKGQMRRLLSPSSSTPALLILPSLHVHEYQSAYGTPRRYTHILRKKLQYLKPSVFNALFTIDSTDSSCLSPSSSPYPRDNPNRFSSVGGVGFFAMDSVVPIIPTSAEGTVLGVGTGGVTPTPFLLGDVLHA